MCLAAKYDKCQTLAKFEENCTLFNNKNICTLEKLAFSYMNDNL